MTDTPTAAAPAAATPVAAAVVAAAKPSPEEEIAALHARFDSLDALIREKLTTAAPAAPVVAEASGPCAAARAAYATWRATKTTGRAIACAYRVLDGLKTIIFFVVSGGLAVATELQAIDLTPYASMILPEGAHVSASQLITLLSLAGIGLRLVTKTPAFVRWTKAHTGGGSDSAVDEPAQG